ncbi:LysR substrate-binding domain-containing protein [Comamonas sp. A7-5]|uniref:LysR substrate-binding domain-containing protein n=1 Tax=Comamonas sp. A7-5 TaxID=673549 RepID=UPI0031CEE774
MGHALHERVQDLCRIPSGSLLGGNQHFEAVSRMIEAGMGIGVLPKVEATAYLHGMKLQTRALKDEWGKRQMLICTAKGREKSEHVDRLLQALLLAAQDTEELD